ncbi:MAG: translation elongation factor Ts [Deltaproteobacteria bacterium]|nr:translation elongation factor Ts [Deltaproteobacteria bacterium]
MTAVNALLVKDLREKTGAGFMDCKKALQEARGDVEGAMTILKKKGQAKASSRAGRTTEQGIVGSYIHAGGKIGVLVEINCETDFVARTADFTELVKNLSMHIAATNPLYIDIESVPHEVLEKEREIYREQVKESGKPDSVLDKIVEGKIKKYYTEVCLLEQLYIKDPEKKVDEIIKNSVATLGENIQVRRFARFALGQ